MKTNKIFLVIVFLCPLLSTGQKNSWDGDGISPHSKFRILNICINVIYDRNPDKEPQNNYNQWGRGYTEGINNDSINRDKLLDFMDIVYTPGNLRGFITRFFGESSFDALQLIGDFVIVNVNESHVLDTHKIFDYSTIIKTAIDLINVNGLQTIYGHNHIADYDYANNNQIYFTHILFRNITKEYGDLSEGQGYGNGPYGFIKIGSTFYSFSGKGIIAGSMNLPLVTHEIGHSLLGDNDFHTMGGNHREYGAQMPFFTLQAGYGVMAGSGKTLESCNGYERWRMHWKHANTPYYIAARNRNNNAYLNSDISKTNGNLSFVLRDFVTYGDAIRIKLPYKDSEDASNQYIWLENHKSGINNKLDYLHHSDNADCRPKGIPGIYAYYQIGRDILSGAESEVYYDNERDNLRMITAEGYWDYSKHNTDPYNMECITWANHNYVISRDLENPFCGYHDVETHFYPDNSDNTLAQKHEYIIRRKKIGHIIIDSLVSSGDNRDVFSGYNKINMGTNPSTCNAKTYYNIIRSGTTSFTGQTYRNNQTTYLTGLSIEMIPLENKDILVNIRWDDYDVTNNTRWSGKISNKEKVNLTSGNMLYLAQNKTPSQPYRDSESGLFSKTTELTCEENSVFTQQDASQVILSDKSKLFLKSGSEYTIMPDAILSIKSGCKLEIEDCAVFKIKGSLVIDYNSTINIHPNAFIFIDDIDKIKYNGNINTLFPSYITNGDRVYTGNDVISQNTILGDIYVESGATLTIKNATIRFTPNAKIIVKSGGRLVLDGCTLTNACNEKLWQGIEVWGNSSNDYQVSAYQGTLEMYGATIENAVCAVSVGELSSKTKGGGIIKASNSNFINNIQTVIYQSYTARNNYGEIANAGTFTDCDFIIDDAALFPGDPTMIELYMVRGIKFNGCSFTNIRSLSVGYEGHGRYGGMAILANHASISITGSRYSNTTIPSEPDRKSYFYGFYTAVSLRNAGTYASKINWTNFDYNYIAIEGSYANKLSVISCAMQARWKGNSAYGIYLFSCDGYTIENNIFSGGYGIGLSIGNSGEGNNFIRYNSFNDLCLAITTFGVNGKTINNTLDCMGLQFKCNAFINNQEDIRIGGTIRRFQGEPDAGAGNAFAHINANVISLNNTTSYYVGYYYNQYYNNPYLFSRHYPYNSHQVDILLANGHSNGCSGGALGLSYYWIPSYNPWNDFAIALSMSFSSTNAINIETIEESIGLDEYTSAYKEITEMLENKKELYYAHYGNKPINWEEISDEENTIDNPQVKLYTEISHLEESIHLICREAFSILSNAEVFDRSTYNSWLERENTLRSYYLLAESYAEVSEWKDVVPIFQKITEKFPDYDSEEHEEIYLCLRQENYWNTQESLVISPAEIAIWEGNLETYKGIALEKVRALLQRATGYFYSSDPASNCTCNSTASASNYTEIFSESSSTGNHKSINNGNEQSFENTNSYSLAVYPNPSNGALHLNLENTTTVNIQQVDVYDIYGRELRKVENIGVHRTTVDLSGLSNGIYFIRVSMDNGETKIRRIVKE